MAETDAFKATRKAYAQGYDRALMLGTLFSIVVVALFAVLVVTNPLGLSYYEIWSDGDVTSFFFAGSIYIYALLTFAPAWIVFMLLFNTGRRIRQMDILLAAQKTLGLLEKEKEEK